MYSDRATRIVERMTDAFERVAGELPSAEVIPLHGSRKATSLADCVPLLAVAIEFLDRGPDALTIQAVESYREKALSLLEHLRPAVERAAHVSVEDWTATFASQAPGLRVAA